MSLITLFYSVDKYIFNKVIKNKYEDKCFYKIWAFLTNSYTKNSFHFFYSIY